jgi:hypothetical protein
MRGLLGRPPLEVCAPVCFLPGSIVLLKKKRKLLNPEWYIVYRKKCHGYDTARIAPEKRNKNMLNEETLVAVAIATWKSNLERANKLFGGLDESALRARSTRLSSMRLSPTLTI